MGGPGDGIPRILIYYRRRLARTRHLCAPSFHARAVYNFFSIFFSFDIFNPLTRAGHSTV